MKKILFAMSALILAAVSAPAMADDNTPSPWFLRAGVAYVDLMDGYKATLGGQAIPGSALHYNHIYTGLVEVGYTFADDFAAVATLGFPPSLSAYGNGSLKPYGKFESTTFGPGAVTVQWSPFHFDMVRPYVGAGLSYMIIFHMKDAVVQNAGLSGNIAPVFEAGTDIALAPQYGLFIEVKKSFLHSKTTGTVLGLPLGGTADLSPWVYSTGMTYRF